MKIIKGDLWDELGRADIIFVTTNSYVNKSGELVMGRGAALQAYTRFPRIARVAGGLIEGKKLYGIQTILKCFTDHKNMMGLFQVKYHFNSKADLSLIKYSTSLLKECAKRCDRIAINYPGIGYGGLKEKDVYPIISKLPDNVRVYMYD